MVTDKNKEQFEKWLINYLIKEVNGYDIIIFELLPFSMQWGVYLEYYDSVGVTITVDYDVNNREPFYYWIAINMETKYSGGDGLSRQEAQTEVLKKADEIVNERLND